MRWSALLAESSLHLLARHGEAEVRNVSADSRRIDAQTCFVAVSGCQADGHDFIPQALAAGAAAVLCQDPAAMPPDADVPWAVVQDTAAALGPLAQCLHGFPARKLTCLAVTGTNGKSTVAHLIREILQALGQPTGLVGTITYETLQRSLPATMTTPDPVALAELTDEMLHAGASHMVMETSSHALQQKRTAGIDFRVGVFTNLSGDHLDYHGDMQRYLDAKCRLFRCLAPDASAVINRDDPHADDVAACTEANLCYYGLSPAADLRGRIDRIAIDGTDLELLAPDTTVRLQTPLIGRHNVYNALAALAAVRALGLPLREAAECLATVRSVPGRLQRVPGEMPFEVFVDYAHTDDALANVLGALRPITTGRLIVVFGCGGDRDRTKRPRMARVARELADHLVVTSDNPRSEDPQAIIDDILAGLEPPQRDGVDVLPDRAEAICHAIDLAGPGDAVLLAGKGHETYQIIREQRRDFDDAEVARRCIQNRQETRT